MAHICLSMLGEPFASWEAEDQREQQRLHALDRRLRLRAHRKEDQEGRTEVSQRFPSLHRFFFLAF